MPVTKDLFGTMPDGRAVDRYTLTNKNGLSASFITLGAVWVTMMAPDRDGKFEDVILGYDTVEAYMANPPHLGAPIGRNANRIGGAKVTIAGVDYPLAANNGPNNLHSGPDYYHSRIWQGESFEEPGRCGVVFSLESPHMDQGYPGNAKIQVSYALDDENALKLEYRMVSDQDTVANFTNHCYFNLAGHQEPDILKQMVWIDADCYTPADEVSIPTGEIAPVEGTPMDFRQMKPIGQDIDKPFTDLVLGNGYDHNWVLNHPAGTLSLAAQAMDPDSGRLMEVYTDLPGMQFYTGNFLSSQLPGKGGADYGRRHAYCFETQYYPDAVHKEHFPSPILKAGEEYYTATVYKFKLS